MATFKVLIVGGSVTGLALANMLEQYGIDYALIEKHETVAPQLGASIGILPHGARILDQLGCYNSFRSVFAPIDTLPYYDADAVMIAKGEGLGKHLEAMLGYKMNFLERQQLLQGLYDHLADKSKIRTSCKAVKIKYIHEGVEIETEDGSVQKGSIVVGADGVHSKIRDEMWRIAEHEISRFRSENPRKAIKATFSCIFGISRSHGKFESNEGFKNVRKGRHYLVQSRADGNVFWFLFFKNETQAKDGKIPRYSSEEKAAYATKFKDDKLKPGFTFADLYNNQTQSALVPLEEYILKGCHHRRIILLGDAMHKVHPLTGHGGNAAIEDAAFLANRLKDLIRDKCTPTESQLAAMFVELEKERQPRVEMLMNGAHGLARLESFDNTFLKFMMMNVVCKMPFESILSSLAVAMGSAVPLKYLPLPLQSKKGVVPHVDEVQLFPRKRRTSSTTAWVTTLLSMGILQLLPFISAMPIWQQGIFQNIHPTDILPWNTITPNSSLFKPLSPVYIYSQISFLAINGLWCLESYRSPFTMCPLSSATIFLCISFMAGWGLSIPLYFALWAFHSRHRAFYYPNPRAIPPAVAEALLPGLILALAVMVYIFVMNPSGVSVLILGQTIVLDPWSLGHGLLPVTIWLGKELITRLSGPRNGPEFQWGNTDMPYISRFQAMIMFITSMAHVQFLTQTVIPNISITHFALPSSFSFGAAALGVFTSLITIWLYFTLWELRRVRITKLGYLSGTLYIILGILIFGPAGSLAFAWGWREHVFERSRQRKV